MTPDQLREAIEYLDACLRNLHQTPDGELRTLDDGEQTDFDEGLALRNRYAADLERHQQIASLSHVPANEDRGAPNVVRTSDPLDIVEDRAATPVQLADALTRSLEDLVEDPDNMAHVRQVARRHSRDREWARNLIVRSSDVYTEAWAKMMTDRGAFLSEEERAAIAVGTTTQGGFLVPTHLDPTIILTNSGTSNAIRAISRVVTLTVGNDWNGVSSAGVTASWDDELEEVSDDSPTFAQPTIPVHAARAFAQASFEAFEDIAGLSTDVLMLFADAKDRLEGAAHATGSGTGEPTGIFTALDANTNVELTSTTAAAIGKVDLNLMYRSVPVRHRSRSSWLMNPLYALAIHDLGTAVSASYSGDLREGTAGTILNKPVVESDDAPTTQTTTVRDNEIVFGNFQNYVIVDKPGSMATEFIPQLFGTTNALPIGARGWICHWRSGADSVNDLAFRLLQDKTSA